MENILHGFQLERKKELKELDATLYQYKHVRTGLELVWLKRNEENKSFCIAFETLPENDTGVFHILEHSTLCGSDKFPVKEPFVELMKNSMNTFLNAFTFPDKTCYPVSSKNSKDFLNLVEVYLDAVFAPAIYKKPEIFHQEGWHYEFNEDGSTSYNGVVFNEMKGVYSDPDELTEYAKNKALYPNTSYKFDYGGDPSRIPDLSYEEFLNTHQRFYSPSNAYVILDGNVDLDAVLKLMNEDYLSKIKPGKRIAPPEMQKPVNIGLVEAEYAVDSEEEEEGKARLVLGSVIGSFAEREKFVAAEILAEVLAGTNHSPLCKAVLESGLAEDILMETAGEMLQPNIKIELRNLKKEDAGKAEELVRSVLQNVVKQGIDKETLDAAIANQKFKMKEGEDYYPQGISLAFDVLASWLYGGEPEANLQCDELFESIKEKAKHGWFEQLIDELLLNNPHSCKVLMLPSHTLGQRRAEAEDKRLEKEISSLNNAQLQTLQKEQEELTCWQQSEDTPQALASMPTLSLADVDPKPEQIPTEIFNGDICVLKHQIGHNGVFYCTLYFDADGFSEQEYSQLALLCEVLGQLGTKKYTPDKLANNIRRLFGDLQFNIASYENEKNQVQTKLCVSYSALSENAKEAQELVLHILTETVFDKTKEIKDIISQRKVELYQEIMQSGSRYALGRIARAYTVSGVISDCASGICYYQYIKSLNKTKDFEFLHKLANNVFCWNNLLISYTGDIPEISTSEWKTLPKESTKGCTQIKPYGTRKEGLIIPSEVSYATLGGKVNNTSCGKLALASHIISLEYLWNVIRVQGGAYGAGLTVKESGFCGCYSYRDPSAAQSLKSFTTSGSFLEKTLIPERDLTGAIIGTVAESSPFRSTKMKGQYADSLYIKGTSYEDLCERRKELLSATPETLLPTAKVLETALNEASSICVIGPKEQLAKCEGLEVMGL